MPTNAGLSIDELRSASLIHCTERGLPEVTAAILPPPAINCTGETSAITQGAGLFGPHLSGLSGVVGADAHPPAPIANARSKSPKDPRDFSSWSLAEV